MRYKSLQNLDLGYQKLDEINDETNFENAMNKIQSCSSLGNILQHPTGIMGDKEEPEMEKISSNSKLIIDLNNMMNL